MDGTDSGARKGRIAEHGRAGGRTHGRMACEQADTPNFLDTLTDMGTAAGRMESAKWVGMG